MLAKKSKILQELTDKIYQVVEKSLTGRDKVAVAFSGGIDSSLLAKVCQDLKKDVTLLTIGFPGAADIEWARKIAEELKLPLKIKKLDRENLEQEIKELVEIIEFPGVRDFEVALSLYIVFKFVAEQDFQTVLTATGLDALFCGFDRTRQLLQEGSRQELDKLTTKIVQHAQQTEKNFDFLASHLNISRLNSFMSQDFIDSALKIPSELKIVDGNDKVRKHILREAAIEMGVPEAAAMRPKKAIQYSTRIDKTIKKIAKQAGTGKREAYFAAITKND